MAACEKAKIGLQATALWSRIKGPQSVKTGNWRHSCGTLLDSSLPLGLWFHLIRIARPVNGRKPWNCFVRRRIPRWHGFDGVFSLKLHMIQKMYNHEVVVGMCVEISGKNHATILSFIRRKEHLCIFGCMMQLICLLHVYLFASVLLFLIDWTIPVHCLCLITSVADHWLSQVHLGEEVGDKRCIMSYIMLYWIQSGQSNCRGVLLVCVQLHLNILDVWCKIPIKYHFILYISL